MVSIPSWWLQIQGSWVVHAGFWSSNDNFQEKGAFATSARKFYARCGDSCRFTWPCDLKSWGTWHFHNFIIVFTWTNTWYWSYSYLCDSSPIVISATSVIYGLIQLKDSNIHQPNCSQGLRWETSSESQWWKKNVSSPAMGLETLRLCGTLQQFRCQEDWRDFRWNLTMWSWERFQRWSSIMSWP